jgi:thymidylate kinase
MTTTHRRAKLICAIGLDGSGKTTLARRLTQELRASGRRTAYLHFWPNLDLFRLPGRRSTSKSPIGLPRWRALGLYALAWLLLSVRLPLLLRRYDIVICDRYVHDLAAYLALREHETLSRRLVRAGARIAPDAVLVLRVSPNARRARKGSALEFPPEVYRAWEALYDEVLDGLSMWEDRTHSLDADRSAEAVYAQAREILRRVGLFPSVAR